MFCIVWMWSINRLLMWWKRVGCGYFCYHLWPYLITLVALIVVNVYVFSKTNNKNLRKFESNLCLCLGYDGTRHLWTKGRRSTVLVIPFTIIRGQTNGHGAFGCFWISFEASLDLRGLLKDNGCLWKSVELKVGILFKSTDLSDSD